MGAHIGALVEVEYVLECQDLALGVECSAGVVALLARVIGSHQMLVSVLDPFDRPPQSHCGDADEKIFGVELAAHAKPAAGVAFLQHHGCCAAAKHARQRVAVAVRYLGRAVQFQHVVGGVEAGERAARLDRYGTVPADCQVEGDDPLGRGKGRVDIAVTGAQHQRLCRQAGRESAGNRAGVQYRRQHIGLD